MLSRFHLVPERNGQTDLLYQYRASLVSMLTRDKKLSGKFGYMGRSNPWDDLDQMCHLGRYG